MNFRYYPFPQVENNLIRHLFETERHTLYCWTDKFKLIQKFQFIYNDCFVVEFDKNGLHAWELNRFGRKELKNSYQTLGGLISVQLSDVTRILLEADTIESNQKKHLFARWREVLKKRKWENIYFD